VPYLLLAVLTLGVGLGLGLGLSEVPPGRSPVHAALRDLQPRPSCVTPLTRGTGCEPLPRPGTPVSLPPGTIVIHHVPYPEVLVPETPCRPVDLSGTVTGMGPYESMMGIEFIVTVSSTEPCRLDGYPVLVFSSSSGPVPEDVHDGGILGSYAAPGPVAVGTGAPASFLIFFGTNPNSPGPLVTSLTFELPGGSASISVNIDNPVGPLGPDPGSLTAVTPFEQGNSVDQYA
jgi:hypothetical protein